MSGKLILLTLSCIGGTIFVISRIIMAALNKRSAHGMINSLKKNPALARDVAASLDLTYSRKENFAADHFDKLGPYLQSIPAAANYRLLYVLPYDRDHILVFTELSFADFDIGLSGKSSDVAKKAYHNFLLTLDRTQNRLTIYSSIHIDVTEKFQKEGFSDAIFKGMAV